MSRARVVRTSGVLLAVGFLTTLTLVTALRASKDAPTGSPESTRAVPVRVISPTSVTGQVERTATGTLTAVREVRVGFPVSGVVARIEAHEGDRVRAGEVLASLDTVPYRAAADQARARAEFLRARLERSRALAESGAIAGEELDADEAELRAAEAELDRAEWNWQRSTLRAPFTGDVRSDRIELGQVVSAGEPAFELIAVDSLEVRVSVAVSDLARIDFTAPVDVRSVDRPAHAARGRIVHPPVSGDPRTSAVPILVRLDNRDRTLLAGTIAEVTFTGSSQVVRPTVPLSSLRVASNGSVVYVVEDGTARARTIETGAVRDRLVEVTSGLDPDARVVAEPPDRLRDGDAVEIVEG
ncbi:MAG: efflux RND transporter periplasmic adaptor subunit [Candidatus Eisenbacteria bacterium]|uniref:Efflux RND transporter periplasmic adaptor subunit n=1 Tax=Eiseniibacteriota bacterium TaxID=2212470 RepID=A0A956NBK4_UNCEI|nr:efflux RND transporter periplasmic adaptor subunit [Candidatus Eisenbacteria bacterium]MCB9463271.1 efflux RND transporter periplasmic adaptor subunit [Candidatus Eisenbacteria bacterium]